MKLVNVGRKTGRLNNYDKSKFRTEMTALVEAVSNVIKVTDDVGDDVNILFKSNESNNHDHCSRQHTRQRGEQFRHRHDSSFEEINNKSFNLRRFRQQVDDDEDDVSNLNFIIIE